MRCLELEVSKPQRARVAGPEGIGVFRHARKAAGIARDDQYDKVGAQSWPSCLLLASCFSYGVGPLHLAPIGLIFSLFDRLPPE